MLHITYLTEVDLEESMGREANIANQLRMVEAVNRGELQVLKEIFTSDVVDHDAAKDQSEGPAGYIVFFEKFRAAFPDLRVSIEQMVADEEFVALVVRVTGTHRGLHLGIKPTGRTINIRGMQLARFNGQGQIQERWGSSDELSMLRQIEGSSDIVT